MKYSISKMTNLNETKSRNTHIISSKIRELPLSFPVINEFASMTQHHSHQFCVNQLKAVIYFKLQAWRLHFEQPQYVNKRSVLLLLPPPLFICMRSLHSISILCHIRKQLHRGLLYQAKKITLFETGWKKKKTLSFSLVHHQAWRPQIPLFPQG